MKTAECQSEHYDRISADYEAHYDDPSSQLYRRRFIYEPMFKGLELRGRAVLEGMCGSGQATQYLVENGAMVTGMDISEKQITSFAKHWPDSRAICGSILDSNVESESYDHVAVIAGLHHVHPHVEDAVREIHRMLRPGGFFCFFEPHKGSIPDVIRRWWYRHDAMFEDNEDAIDVDALKARFSGHFEFTDERYVGNFAYILVLNSLILRIPLSLKKYYAPLLMPIERVIAPLQNRVFSCCTICRWQKK